MRMLDNQHVEDCYAAARSLVKKEGELTALYGELARLVAFTRVASTSMRENAGQLGVVPSTLY